VLEVSRTVPINREIDVWTPWLRDQSVILEWDPLAIVVLGILVAKSRSDRVCDPDLVRRVRLNPILVCSSTFRIALVCQVVIVL